MERIIIIQSKKYKEGRDAQINFAPGFEVEVKSEPSCDVDSCSTAGTWLGVGAVSTLGFWV